MGTVPRNRVLIVDDDRAARETLEALLSEEFETEAVADVAAAEAVLIGNAIDVVVTDHEMPGGTGLQLLRKVEAQHPVVVGILVTGHGRYPEVERARHNWRDFRVLLKPYDPEALLRTVRNAASIAMLRRATQRRPRQR